MTSRSLLSSLLVLEKHYSTNPHVQPSWNEHSTIQSTSKTNANTNTMTGMTERMGNQPTSIKRSNCLGHVDRMKKRKRNELYGRVGLDLWIDGVKNGLNQLSSIQNASPKSSSLSVDLSPPKSSSIEISSAKKEEKVETKPTIKAKTNTSTPIITTQTTTTPKPLPAVKDIPSEKSKLLAKKSSLKDKLKKNPLLRFK